MVIADKTVYDVITEFLASKEAGLVVTQKKAALERAAQNMFTAKGLDCPVRVLESNGTTYLINRNIIKDASE